MSGGRPSVHATPLAGLPPVHTWRAATLEGLGVDSGGRRLTVGWVSGLHEDRWAAVCERLDVVTVEVRIAPQSAPSDHAAIATIGHPHSHTWELQDPIGDRRVLNAATGKPLWTRGISGAEGLDNPTVLQALALRRYSERNFERAHELFEKLEAMDPARAHAPELLRKRQIAQRRAAKDL